MRIMIGNLPADATEEGVQEALAAFGPVESVKLITEGGAPTAMIETDMGQLQAEALCRRIQGRIFKGKPLNAWVPAMPWSKT
jgi:hypothetical protein